jgi:antitoxin component YwqK of YwqJK toxin-antitoxin module
MGKIDWDVVTNFTDAVTTTLKTVTFPKVQEQVYLRNQGNANFTYTIGSQSGTLTPGQSVTVNQDVSSFTLQAVSGTHTFEVRANEKGTEKTEAETDVFSQLADITTVNNHTITYSYYPDGNIQTVTEKDNSNNAVKTVTYNYNASGDVSSSVTVMNGKTVTTTFSYDVNGNIQSTSNVIS